MRVAGSDARLRGALLRLGAVCDWRAFPALQVRPRRRVIVERPQKSQDSSLIARTTNARQSQPQSEWGREEFVRGAGAESLTQDKWCCKPRFIWSAPAEA